MRLIDADKLKVYRCDDSASRATFDYIYEDDVEDAPTIDLVRCGECKHKPIKHDPEGDDFGFNLVSPNGYDNLCPCLNTDDGFYSYMPENDFFCAFGERRSDERPSERLRECVQELKERLSKI